MSRVKAEAERFPDWSEATGGTQGVKRRASSRFSIRVFVVPGRKPLVVVTAFRRGSGSRAHPSAADGQSLECGF